MKHLIFFLFASAPSLHAEPVVTNVRAAQIPGKHQVRITYDLAATALCTVTVQATRDGAVVGIPNPEAYQGDGVGTTVIPGTGKSITLTVDETTDSGTTVMVAALQNIFTKNLRFKVLATENSTGPAPTGFSLIPAGDFVMGQTGLATPVHAVYVSAFYMAKYETTKELWDSVRAWGLTRSYTDLAEGNSGYASKGANHPVHSITWYDMAKWCNARSEKDNLVPCYYTDAAQTLIYKTGSVNIDNTMVKWNANGYRLPTEAEWEKAARGGVTGKNFPWGTDTISHSQANYFSSSSYAFDVSPTRGNHPTYAVGAAPYSSPVGSFAPNGYGLYDMAGNMWERCWDWYASYTEGSQTDPRGGASGSVRVFRGGSWGTDWPHPWATPAHCLVAVRGNGLDYSPAFSFMGFRIVRSLGP